MRRVIGFATFFLALGIIIGVLITSSFVSVMIILLSLIISYLLFCCN